MSLILSTKEVAEYLKLHEVTVAKYAAEGEIPAFRARGRWWFDKESIDKWLREKFKNKD